MLTAKEVADSFGLSINELAKITGYSRVSLYNIFNYEGKNANREEKLKKMYDILCQLNTKLEQQAAERAKLEQIKREMMLEKIAKRCNVK